MVEHPLFKRIKPIAACCFRELSELFKESVFGTVIVIRLGGPASGFKMRSWPNEVLSSSKPLLVSKYDVPLKMGSAACTGLISIDEVLALIASSEVDECFFIVRSPVVDSEYPVASIRRHNDFLWCIDLGELG